MGMVKAADGKVVTDEMIDSWCEALDCDEWTEGWTNGGEILNGKLPEMTETESPSSKRLLDYLLLAHCRENLY